jgi:branched-chain amino acid transport system substrate-binding protein
MYFKRACVSAMLVAGATVVAACGGSSSDESAAAKGSAPIKIGVIESLSGPLTAIGLDQWNAISMLTNKLNAAGGVGGHKIELVRRNDNSDPAEAAKQIRGFASDKSVVAAVGPTGSAAVLAAKPVIESLKLPMVSAVSAAALSDPPVQWWFRSIAKDTQQTQGVLNFIKAAGKTKVALLNASDPFGQSGAEQFKKEAPAMGMTITSAQSYPLDTTDPSVQVAKVKASNPDAYIIWDGTSEARLALTLKTLKSAGSGDAPVLLPESATSSAFTKAAGSAAEGAFYFAFLAPNDPRPGAQSDFVKAWQAAHSSALPDDSNAMGYAAMSVVVKGITDLAAANKAITREGLRDAIEAIQGYDSTTGTMSFGPGKHDPIALSDVQINMIDNGTTKRAQPSDVK